MGALLAYFVVLFAIVAFVVFISAFVSMVKNTGNWLVIVYRSDEIQEHWIFKNTYRMKANDFQGWMFYDSDGQPPVHIPATATVIKIIEPLNEFLLTYKMRYDIPEDQEPKS